MVGAPPKTSVGGPLWVPLSVHCRAATTKLCVGAGARTLARSTPARLCHSRAGAHILASADGHVAAHTALGSLDRVETQMSSREMTKVSRIRGSLDRKLMASQTHCFLLGSLGTCGQGSEYGGGLGVTRVRECASH